MNDALAELHSRELNVLRSAHDAGNPLGTLAAFEYCRARSIELPVWLGDKIAESLAPAEFAPRRARGRHAAAHTRVLAAVVDFTRYDLFVSVREHQAGAWREFEAEMARFPSGSPGRARLEAHRPLDLGRTRMDALLAVSKMCAGSRAAGSAEAVRKSVNRVARSMRDPRQAGLYALIPRSILRRFGLDISLVPLVGPGGDRREDIESGGIE